MKYEDCVVINLTAEFKDIEADELIKKVEVLFEMAPAEIRKMV